MEKLFLRSFFISKKLNIVDQQCIYGTVVAFKLFDRVVLQSFNHVLNKALGVHINHFGIRLARHNAVTHRMQQVSFTQTRAAIKEQRVISTARVICHLASRRARQLVRFTFNEVIKRVFDVYVRTIGRFCRSRDVIPTRARRRRSTLRLRLRHLCRGRDVARHCRLWRLRHRFGADFKTQLWGIRSAETG